MQEVQTSPCTIGCFGEGAMSKALPSDSSIRAGRALRTNFRLPFCTPAGYRLLTSIQKPESRQALHDPTRQTPPLMSMIHLMLHFA